MSAIKSIKVGETVYDLKATYDGSGNVIDQTYAKSSAIPTKVSQLQNDENYLKEHQDISGLATKTELGEQFDILNTAWKELQKEQQSLSKQVTELSSNVDLYSYGVEWDITVSSPILTRIGNPLLHKSLPIQSAYRGCVANNGVVNYYLYPDNWAYKEDGSTPSVLDGTDGTVRVHTPKFYGKSGSNGNKRWVRISLVKLDDSWIEIPELLIDAYRSTVDNTVSETPKAVSVVNTTEAFRGGGNREQFDEYLTTELDTKDAFRSDLGKPRTNVSRANMRTYAINAGSELLCYEYYKWIFYWNYIIEYANFNSQEEYNAELTSEGYRQGGLGNGIINMTNWSIYNNTFPLTPCGFGNSIGNFTGIKDLVIPSFQYVVNSDNFNFWNNNITIITATNSSNNSKLITQVKGIDDCAFYANANNVWGSVTYNISGLTGGQKVIFKEKKTNSDYTTAETILEVDSDGEFTVTWSDYNVGSTKYVGFSIKQENCNIKIYNVNTNSYTLQQNTQTLKMPRWRGFDNPFGDTWTNLDGVVIQRTAANEISSVYTTTNKEEFTDVIGGKTIAGYEVAQDGYIKEFDLGETAEIIPSSCVESSATTYMCDYHWCNLSYTELRTLLVGGRALHGGSAGLGCFSSSIDVGVAASDVGFRTLNRVS